MQDQINDWHIKNRNSEFNLEEYKNFLIDIGYIHPRSGDFKIETWNVDPEIRKIAGPQLVVPVMNADLLLMQSTQGGEVFTMLCMEQM